MVRFVAAVLAAGLLAGCGDKPPTEFKNKKDDHDHKDHEQGAFKLEDVGPYHAGLTAHLSKEKDGNELDVKFETTSKKDPKPVPLPLAKLTGRATRAGDDAKYDLVFEPADKDERKGDPDGKCSRFTAKAGWMKPDDKVTVTLTVPINGKDEKAVWVDFDPKKFSHSHEKR